MAAVFIVHLQQRTLELLLVIELLITSDSTFVCVFAEIMFDMHTGTSLVCL